MEKCSGEGEDQSRAVEPTIMMKLQVFNERKLGKGQLLSSERKLSFFNRNSCSSMYISERLVPPVGSGIELSFRRASIRHRGAMCPSLSLSGYAAVADNQAALRRRKLSQAVANKLIGWRTSQTQQLVVEEAKSLCGKYLRSKLRSCALLHKKLGLQRLKSVSVLSSAAVWPSAEVALELRELGMEMERTHPELFQSVIENVGLYTLPSESVVHNLLHALASELFREGKVSWGRIVALYAMAGALAVDCVKLGHPEFVLGLVQVVGTCVERDLGNWIIQQGGWAALLTRFKKNPTLQRPGVLFLTILLLCAISLIYYFFP